MNRLYHIKDFKFFPKATFLWDLSTIIEGGSFKIVRIVRAGDAHNEMGNSLGQYEAGKECI